MGSGRPESSWLALLLVLLVVLGFVIFLVTSGWAWSARSNSFFVVYWLGGLSQVGLFVAQAVSWYGEGNESFRDRWAVASAVVLLILFTPTWRWFMRK